MPRRQIIFAPGECYHLYNRGCNRHPIFFEHENYLFFLRELKKRFREHDVTVLVWCLMPNHYHLVVAPLSDGLAAAMQACGTSYTKAINKRRKRSGTLFEGRFQAVEVKTAEQLSHLSRYVHLNPVKARLVTRPQDWEFSSYRDYLGLRAGTLAQPERVHTDFASVEHYRLFVESGIDRGDDVISGLVYYE